MDYSIILNTIASNQSAIISLLSSIKECLGAVVMVGGIYFLYVFIRNLIKTR